MGIKASVDTNPPSLGGLQFVRECKVYHSCPSPLANELAIIGRSNAGKSSLINRLAGQKSLARVSSTPGRTRSLVFFGWEGYAQMLVDLPGYGFARTSKQMQREWRGLIETYLLQRPNLRALVLVMDCRRELGEQEIMLLDLARRRGLELCLAMNKCDKLGQSQLALAQRNLNNALKKHQDDFFRPQAIACSATKGRGCDRLGAWALAQLGMGDAADSGPARESEKQQPKQNNE